MSFVALLGDSILDNGAYVSSGTPIIDQLRAKLPRDWRAELLAKDGAIVNDVSHQLTGLPADASYLVISAGGNDALESTYMLRETDRTAAQGFADLAAVQEQFKRDYKRMIRALCQTRKAVALCTIYDSVPDLSPIEVALLSVFNDVILREGFRVGLPIIDLRLVCDEPRDYSTVSPIEPSEIGGFKIASSIANVVRAHDFGLNRTVVYGI